MSCRYLFLAGLILTSVISLSPAAAETGGSGGESQYEQAVQLRAQGQMAEAEKAFLQAIQEEPNNPDYHFELANLYVALYDKWQGSARSQRALMLLSMAEREFLQTVNFRTDHLPARFNLGVVYKSEGQYEKAREEFRGVLQRSPQQASAWYQIAATYEEQGFWDEAHDALMKARDLGYDPAQIEDALSDIQRAQTVRQQNSASSLASRGGFRSRNRNNFMDDPPSSQGYGSGYDPNFNSGGGQPSQPSMAAMLLQQVLSRRSQN